MDRRARCRAARPARAAARPARGGSARTAGVGRHLPAGAAGWRRPHDRDRRVPRAHRRRRDLPGEPVPPARGRVEGRPARPLRAHRGHARAAPRRSRGRPLGCRVQPLPGAVPAPPRPRGRERADQGHGAAGARRRPRGHARRGQPRRPRRIHEGPRRERDDRGPDAQRPRARVRVRLDPRAGAHRAAARAGRVAPGLDRHRHAAARCRRRRPAPRQLPARLGDRRAEDPGDARDRRAGGRRPRGVHRRARLREPGGRARAERGDPDARDARRAHLDGRGRRDRGRLRGRARARGVLREGAPGDRRRGRATDRGAAREPRGADPGARRRSRPARRRPRRLRDAARARRLAGRRPRAPGPARAQRERAVWGGAAGGSRTRASWRPPRRPRRVQRLRVVAAPGAGRARASRSTPSRSRPSPRRTPVTLSPAVLPGGLGAHKWRDRRLLDELAGRLDAVPLLLDLDGDVLEAAYANLFIVEGTHLVTPPLDGRQLPGTVRARVLALHPAREERLSLDRIAAADELLLASSVRGHPPGAALRRPRAALPARCAPAGSPPRGQPRGRSPDEPGRLLRSRARGRRGQRRRRAPRAPGARPARLHRRRRARHLADAPARPARGGPARRRTRRWRSSSLPWSARRSPPARSSPWWRSRRSRAS